MNFFFDRNMPPQLARMVGVFHTKGEHVIRHHNDDSRFNERTTDIEWISALGKDRPTWTVISHDGAILRNAVERAALRDANLTFFFLKGAWLHLTIHEKACKFLRVWPEVIKEAQCSVPTAFEIPVKSLRCEKIRHTSQL